jgi:hypothetical protein
VSVCSFIIPVKLPGWQADREVENAMNNAEIGVVEKDKGKLQRSPE